MTKKNQKPEIKRNPVDLQFNIKNWHVILFFGLITFFFFLDIITQKKFFWEDFTYQYYPFRNFAAVALSNGIIPFWNPFTFGGMPFLADIQTAFFYPLHLLLTLFVTNGSLSLAALEYLIIFHYFLAGIFCYYLAKSFNLNTFASIMSGIIFMFCGFMVTHLIHETMIIQFTYMPLIFLFYHKSFEKEPFKNSLFTGLFMGIAILCGHPQITLYMFFTFFLYALYRIFFSLRDNKYKPSKQLITTAAFSALPFVLGIMIGSVQLLPTLTISGLSERAVMTYDSTLEGSLGYHNLFTLFSPKFFGSTNAAHTDIPYWGDKGYWLYWESCVYTGLSAMFFGALAVFTIRKNRIILFLTGISLLSILYVLGDNFIMYKLFYYVIPGFNKFRGVGRFGLVFSFGISILAAYGFDYLIKNPSEIKVKKFLKYSLYCIGCFALLWMLYQANAFKSLANTYNNPVFYKNSITQLGITIITLLLILGLAFSYTREFLAPSVTLFLIILVTFFDLYIFGANHNISPNDPNIYYRNRELAAQFREEGKKELFRINSRAMGSYMVFERNQGMLDQIFLLEGYNPLNLQKKFPPGRTHDLMNVKYVTKVDEATRSMNLVENQTRMPRAWISYRPVVISNDEQTIKILSDTTFDYRRSVTLNKAPEISIDSVTGKNNVTITGYELNKISISAETDKNGILVLSEVYYPAWKVFVDGVEKPLLQCDYSLRAVEVEKGKHEVIFKYIDNDFRKGSILSLAGLGIIILGIGITIFRDKTKKAA